MSAAFDEFKAAFDKYLDQDGLEDALATATGMFVGLIEAVTDQAGHDSSKEITIKSVDNRDITIHAVKT